MQSGTFSPKSLKSLTRRILSFPSSIIAFRDIPMIVLSDSSFGKCFRDLGNSNISGSLGPELGRLVNLKYLYAPMSIGDFFFCSSDGE